MDKYKLARYCELKLQLGKIEEELDELRQEIVGEFEDNTEVRVGDHMLKIIYQEKKQYIEQLLFEALPDPELWRHVSKADPAKISAMVKAGVLSEQLLQGTYKVSRTPYLYVNS